MTTKREDWRRWATPAFGLVMGVVMGGVFLARREPVMAAAAVAILWFYAALLVVGRDHDTIGLLGAGKQDERTKDIGFKAAAFSSYALIAAILSAWIWELLHGRDGYVFSNLGFIGGTTNLLATLWFKRRNS